MPRSRGFRAVSARLERRGPGGRALPVGLATEELLVEAHQEGETALGSVGFFVGLLIYLLLDELVARPG